MKKIVVLLLVCFLLISGVSAASARYKTAVSLNSDELFLNIKLNNNSGFRFDVALNADFVALFSNNNMGPYAKLTMDLTKQKFIVYPAFAYMTPMSNKFDAMFTVGPRLEFMGKNFNLGFDILAHIEYKFSTSWFARFSTGFMMTFLSVNSGNAQSGFDLLIPLPYIGLGYRYW